MALLLQAVAAKGRARVRDVDTCARPLLRDFQRAEVDERRERVESESRELYALAASLEEEGRARAQTLEAAEVRRTLQAEEADKTTALTVIHQS